MNNRDELAELVQKFASQTPADWIYDDEAKHIADALIRAGYSRPRTVSTVAELDALPDGAVIRDNIGIIRERFDDDDSGAALWYRTASGGWALSKQCRLPASVLYEPEGK